MSREKTDKNGKETVDPLTQYLKNSLSLFFYSRLSSSHLLPLLFIINSLVGSWNMKVLKAYQQQAVLKNEGARLSFSEFSGTVEKTVHTDANYKTHRWTGNDL